MRSLFIFSFLFTLSISHVESQYQALLIDKSLTDNANAVVRLDEMKINVLATDKMVYTVNQVITVLNEKGNRHSLTRVGYDKEKKIKSLDVYVYNQTGKEIEHIKKKDFQDVNAADGISLYNDSRLLYHEYTPTSYPYTIAESYTIETSDTGFFPPWYFLSNYMVSVEKSYFEVLYATPELKPDVKEFNLDGISVDKIVEEGKIIYKAENINAIKSESYSPSFRDIVPRLSLRMKKFNLKGEEARVNNWNEMGVWINNALLKDRAILSEATVAKAKNLVKGITDDLEKARVIYKYVQDNTRYISVQVGIGGWEPISAIDVDNVKYGDCKGLSNYMHALLNAVGVTSYYTVIQAGNQKIDFDSEFSALQGNHAILAIPYNDQYYWVDCTSQIIPFGFAGEFTDDRLALVVKPEGGEIIKTVSYLNGQNHQKTVATYNLKDDGSISGEVSIKTKGTQYNQHFRIEEQSKDDVIEHYKDYWDNINNLNIEEYQFSNDKDSIVFTERIKVSATNYTSKTNNRILFKINAFNNNDYVPNRYRSRKQAVEVQRGFLDEDEFEVQLPEGYLVESIPSPVSIENEFGHYKITMDHDSENGLINYRRSWLLKSGLYPKEKYGAYRDFFKKVASGDNAQIVLLKNNQ
ncbi:DUF3857 domain-containing transglutaminase family protein [Flagellimonas eckloniae]|uniref:DUF3857 domain-containing protein n=1 Tax=Flagellimonas eckloniae TaxID=346185 RepID=A0A0N8WFW8_9FLAO|nr:DUF3857 and transglutaminase domain-containing protein [Allomuricauda eckloniae]KQC29859.1 hypothetical protein AAY42_08155 [Allomuricauda eckloniae]